MIFVFAAFFSETDYLRRARLAGNVESGQLDIRSRAGDVNDRPHRVDY